MRLFIQSLSDKLNDIQLPTSLSFVGKTQTTGGNGGQTGHIQGIAIAEDINRVFISWTSGVSAFAWDTKEYLYTTPALIAYDSLPYPNGHHIGDICYVDGKIYGADAGDGYLAITPSRNVVHEWDATDLSLLRHNTVTSLSYCGAFGFDGFDLWLSQQGTNRQNGILQRLKISDLSLYDEDYSFYPNTNPIVSDFGAGFESLNFLNRDKRIIVSADYINSAFTAHGSNIKFSNTLTKEYVRFRYGQIPYDYGSDNIENKLFLIQKGGGSSNVYTDILEFNINY